MRIQTREGKQLQQVPIETIQKIKDSKPETPQLFQRKAVDHIAWQELKSTKWQLKNPKQDSQWVQPKEAVADKTRGISNRWRNFSKVMSSDSV